MSSSVLYAGGETHGFESHSDDAVGDRRHERTSGKSRDSSEVVRAG
jgi:hypothetical protein